jgi:hypothetical protein
MVGEGEGRMGGTDTEKGRNVNERKGANEGGKGAGEGGGGEREWQRERIVGRERDTHFEHTHTHARMHARTHARTHAL